MLRETHYRIIEIKKINEKERDIEKAYKEKERDKEEALPPLKFFFLLSFSFAVLSKQNRASEMKQRA